MHNLKAPLGGSPITAGVHQLQQGTPDNRRGRRLRGAGPRCQRSAARERKAQPSLQWARGGRCANGVAMHKTLVPLD